MQVAFLKSKHEKKIESVFFQVERRRQKCKCFFGSRNTLNILKVHFFNCIYNPQNENEFSFLKFKNENRFSFFNQFL